MSDRQNHVGKGGYPEDPDLPDNVSALYVSTKNTWQDAENLDDTHGYNSYIWIPEETFEVRIMKLHVYSEKFRAYSKSALGGGAAVVTSGASSESTTADGGAQVVASAGGSSHQHKVADVSAFVSDYTKRRIYVIDANGYYHYGNVEFLTLPGGGWQTSLEGGAGAHTHNVSLPDHTHGMAHTHDVTLEDHTHEIDFGIYEEAITGRTLSAVLYDPDDNEVHDFGVILTGEDDVVLDLSDYFDTLEYGMYRLALSASGRLRARLVFYELCVMYAA